MRQLSEHFHEQEFACPCCGQVHVDTALVDLLEEIRNHFGRPVIVNSGYRCDIHNKTVGGGEYSRHLKGAAADIVVSGVSPAKVRQFLYGRSIGLGSYETFTHVDTRGYMARWNG